MASHALDRINTEALRDPRKLRVVQPSQGGIQFISPSSQREKTSVLRMSGVASSRLVRKKVEDDTPEAITRFLGNKVTGQYIQTCRNISVDFNLTTSVIPFLLANLKSVSHEEVLGTVFREMDHEPPFVDWAWVRENITKPNTNSLGDTSCWLTFMRHIHFSDEIETETERLLCFHTFKSLLRSVGFVDKEEIGIKDMIKVYLLLNIVGLTGHHAMERYLAEVLGGNIRTRCLQFAAKLGDQRYSTEDYNEAAVSVLSCITISPTFAGDIQVHIATKKELDMQMRQKEIEMYKGRPRLSAYLQKDSRASRSDPVSVHNMHTFDIWLNFVKFPNTISRKTRNSVYLLMSIPSLTHSDWINRCLTKELATSVLSAPVTNPELNAICQIISGIDYRAQAFRELADFRNECLHGLSQKNMKEMTLSRLMQLYVCAYQCKHIWKDCWRFVLPVLSFPLVQSVEGFVAKNRINETEVYKALMYSA